MGRTDIIKHAVDALQRGDVIAFPTDTVYGLGADAYNDDAIDKIYRIKRRRRDKPLILFIKNKAELPQYVTELTEATLSLVEKYWPGPLTLIFKAKPSTPCQTANHTIGVGLHFSDIEAPATTQIQNYLSFLGFEVLQQYLKEHPVKIKRHSVVTLRRLKGTSMMSLGTMQAGSVAVFT